MVKLDSRPKELDFPTIISRYNMTLSRADNCTSSKPIISQFYPMCNFLSNSLKAVFFLFQGLVRIAIERNGRKTDLAEGTNQLSFVEK